MHTDTNKALGTDKGTQGPHTPGEAPHGGQILPPGNNKGHGPKCIACGSGEELTPVEPGLFKDAHLCRPCADRARALTEDKENTDVGAIILRTKPDDELPSLEWDENEPGFIEVTVKVDSETKVWLYMSEQFVNDLKSAINYSHSRMPPKGVFFNET